MHTPLDVIGNSEAFVKSVELAKRVANSSASVLITGESGTGKELFARIIHMNSPRKDGPFVAINCSAIPENLLESELFGYVKGAFTGAVDKKLGLFEEAEGGTFFLDEIGDLSLPFQAKLLRVLQERYIKRLGENQSRLVNIRIISATHINIREKIHDKTFRDDLYFRIAVIPIHIPALRERRSDIALLAQFFLKKYANLNKALITGFTEAALEHLIVRPWMGNVRELENAIERAVVLRGQGVIDLEDLTFNDEESTEVNVPERRPLIDHEKPLVSLHELTENYIVHALKQNNGAKDKTAKILGIDRKTLYRKIHDFEARGLI